jgi:hypothetical protein
VIGNKGLRTRQAGRVRRKSLSANTLRTTEDFSVVAFFATSGTRFAL